MAENRTPRENVTREKTARVVYTPPSTLPDPTPEPVPPDPTPIPPDPGPRPPDPIPPTPLPAPFPVELCMSNVAAALSKNSLKPNTDLPDDQFDNASQFKGPGRCYVRNEAGTGYLSLNPNTNMIEDHNAGSKFIIWTPFVHEIEYIIARLAKVYGPDSVRAYYGKTDKSLRSDIEDAYCNDPQMRYFVGNAASAGLGLTLISGESDIMVYYSGTNAYIDRAQSEDRAHRIGQHNSVVVADIVMERTVDESIAESIALKMNVEEYIMERLAKGEPLQFEG